MTKNATVRQRAEVHALRRAGKTQKEIARLTGFKPRRISYILSQPVTPPRRSGRPVLLNTPKRKLLVDFIKASAANRRLPVPALALKFNTGVTGTAIRTALERENLARRIARRKFLLTDAHRAKRVEWAQSVKDWTIEDWRRVYWTDESSINVECPHRDYVTRSPDETFHKECIGITFRHPLSCMIWGGISGYGTGSLVIWDGKPETKGGWGKINSISYCKHIVSVIADDLAAHPDLRLMEDNAPCHKSKYTNAEFEARNIVRMAWPANSPDLNPIEHIWYYIKKRVWYRHPRTLKDLQEAIREEWASIPQEYILELVDSMKERVEAILLPEVQGGHTKW